MNNMMRGNRQPIRQRPNTQQSNRQRYAQQYARFIQSQFTYNTHNLLKKICENGQNQPYMYGIPIYKIMLEVVKIMMMNQLQTLFLGSTLQQMKWKITDPCLNQYVAQATDITPGLQKDQQTKKVQFSLLLISYIVKMYLNQDITLYDFKIRDIIRHSFDKMYQEWVKRVSSHFKFNPKSMNRIFKDYETQQHQNKQQIIDYNRLVAQYFRQNDSPFYQERQQQIMKPQEQQIPSSNYRTTRQPSYQNNKIELTHNNYSNDLYRKNTPSFNTRRNDVHQVPMQEEPEIPQSNERRQSARLAHKTSEIGFVRRQSGNQFFAPQTSRQRSGIFNLSMMQSQRIDQESPHK